MRVNFNLLPSLVAYHFIATGDTTLTSGVWWDVTAVCDGSFLYIYVNGVLDATPEAAGVMDNDPCATWSRNIKR